MHHYTEHITVDDIAHADEVVANVCSDYDALNSNRLPAYRHYENRRSRRNDTCISEQETQDDTRSNGGDTRLQKPQRSHSTKMPIYDVKNSDTKTSTHVASEGFYTGAEIEIERYDWTPVTFPTF